MNNLIINQPFGLGDIIFLQGLVEKLRQDYNVIFPVADEYAWVKDYLERENVQFPKKSEVPINYEDANMREGYLPLRFATQVLRGLHPHDYSHDYTVMEDKYSLVEENPSIWRNFTIKRNLKKEQELINHLGLVRDDYVFVNENYGSCAVGRGSINLDKVEGNVVNMSIIEGYSYDRDWET